MQENVAAGLSYVLMWVTGLIFYLTDKRKFVRFHAAQSIVIFGGLGVLSVVLGMITGASLFAPHAAAVGLGIFGLLSSLLWFVTVILWIVCMIMAFQGKNFRVPIAADLADSIFKP